MTAWEATVSLKDKAMTIRQWNGVFMVLYQFGPVAEVVGTFSSLDAIGKWLRSRQIPDLTA